MLAEHGARWTEELKANPQSKACRYRYRDPEIKSTLKMETNDKCVYCESKIGHNTPGDVEHKIPTSRDIDKHFSWDNLTVACTECNRRKNDYYSEEMEFLDPYKDDVESMLVHCGPIVRWITGNSRAEVAVKALGLMDPSRVALVCRKIEKLREVADLLERYREATNAALKGVLRRQLSAMANVPGEYSAMVSATLEDELQT